MPNLEEHCSRTLKRYGVPMLFLMLIVVSTVLVALPVSALVEGDPAPDFTITDIDGNVFTLSNYRGKVVLLEFFNSFCEQCQKEVADLKQVYQTYGQDVLVIFSISEETSATRLRYFRDDLYQIPWRIAGNGPAVWDKYAITTYVTLVIVNQGGSIYWRHVGYTDAATIKAKIDGTLDTTPIVTSAEGIPIWVMGAVIAAIGIGIAIIGVWRRRKTA